MRRSLSLLCIAAVASASLVAGLSAETRRTVFPQLAVGDGFTCDYFFVNQGYRLAEDITVLFYGGDGNPMVVEVDSVATQATVFDLGPGQTRTFRVGSSQPLQVGYAVAILPAGSSVRGTAVIRFAPGTQTLTQLGVSQLVPGTSFTVAAEVRTSSGIDTGLALANGRFPRLWSPEPRAQGIVVNLINGAGELERTAVVDLAEGGHRARLLPEIFPGLDNFVGSVSVSAGVDIGVLALRLDQGILSSVAVDPGPVFSALDFAGSLEAEPETEPNDFAPEAQPITTPARIAGALEENTGPDLFLVTAQAGRILTAYVLAGEDSNLDAYLTVELPDGVLVAANDRMGLVDKRDAFIQMVVPADGDYILRVEDFHFRQGAFFDYELLVNLETP